jgi:hypothetical protein
MRLWTAVIAYKGCNELAESFPGKAQAQQAIIKHLREYHHYDGPANFAAAMSWIAEWDERFDVQLFQQTVRLPPPPEEPAKLRDDPSGQLPARRKRIYLRHKSNRCPLCGSQDIEGTGQHEADADWHTNKVRCNTCGAEWNDIYTLSDIELTEPPSKAGRSNAHPPTPPAPPPRRIT